MVNFKNAAAKAAVDANPPEVTDFSSIMTELVKQTGLSRVELVCMVDDTVARTNGLLTPVGAALAIADKLKAKLDVTNVCKAEAAKEHAKDAAKASPGPAPSPQPAPQATPATPPPPATLLPAGVAPADRVAAAIDALVRAWTSEGFHATCKDRIEDPARFPGVAYCQRDYRFVSEDDCIDCKAREGK
jgi:hypothetical protein